MKIYKPHYYKKPKTKTLNGKKYLVLGHTGHAIQPRAIAQFKTKYGWRDVRNEGILISLYKKTK